MKNIRIEKFKKSDCDDIIIDYQISDYVKETYQKNFTYTFVVDNEIIAIFCFRIFKKTNSIECCMTVSKNIKNHTKSLLQCCKIIKNKNSFLFDDFVLFAIVSENFDKNIRFLEFFGFTKYCINNNKQIMIFSK